VLVSPKNWLTGKEEVVGRERYVTGFMMEHGRVRQQWRAANGAAMH
jgi:hypothetical protein